MQQQSPHRGYFSTLFGCRCPRCREGKLFTHPLTFRFQRNTEMHEKCPVCQQPTDIEVGFYYGTGYISYLAALLMTVASFLLWLLFIGFSFSDRRFLYWIISNSVMLFLLQPWLMRFSRVFWLSCFVHYDPDWAVHKPEDLERIVEGEMNNW
ncbi:MAG: DUF983 domain-containing protein [Flavisolibacter sp.]